MQQQLDNAYKRQTSLAADEKRLIQCQNQIKHTKAGSIAMVGKITTLSKLRISNPVHPGDPLDGIRLSIDSMNKICEKVDQFYLHPISKKR